MARILTEKIEIKELFNVYFWYMKGRYFIEALKSFSIGEGYGQEYVCCTFPGDYQQWEEGYFGDSGVKISADYPAVDNDIIAIISNEEFFQYLIVEGNKFIKQFPEKIDEVNEYLIKIKERLGIS